MIVFYIATLLILTVFSFGLVDANFPYHILPVLESFVRQNGLGASILYTCLLVSLFAFYWWILREVRKGKVSNVRLWRLIFLSIGILFFAFPGLSFDVFNYIATAKITYLYKENPYIVMPIEISNEPMLAFLHAANKVALYGFVWIVFAFVPYILGLGQLFVTLYFFKIFIFAWYLVATWLVWVLGNKKPWSLAFFAFNPLVLTETLLAGHNDVVMMALALGSFWFLKKKKIGIACILLFLSIGIKFATLFLFPIIWMIAQQLWQDTSIDWNRIWRWSAWAMLAAFFLSPLREELYPWYFLWPLTFIALLRPNHFLVWMSYGFSFGLPFRFVPFLVTRRWDGLVPLIKKFVSFVPPLTSSLIYAIKKNR